MNALGRIQYHSTRAIIGSWKGTNLNKIHDELSWGPLTGRCGCRHLFHFYKIQNNLIPPYLKAPIPLIRTHLVGSRSNLFSNSILIALRRWNKIWPELRNSSNLKLFKVSILSLIRPPHKSIFDIHS